MFNSPLDSLIILLNTSFSTEILTLISVELPRSSMRTLPTCLNCPIIMHPIIFWILVNFYELNIEASILHSLPNSIILQNQSNRLITRLTVTNGVFQRLYSWYIIFNFAHLNISIHENYILRNFIKSFKKFVCYDIVFYRFNCDFMKKCVNI